MEHNYLVLMPEYIKEYCLILKWPSFWKSLSILQLTWNGFVTTITFH